MKKILLVVVVVLFAGVAVAQQWVVIPSQPQQRRYQPQYPAYVDPEYNIDGRTLIPPAPPQTGYIYDQRGRSYQYEETAPGSGNFFVYPQQSND